MKKRVELTLTLVVLFVSMIPAGALQKPADAQQNPRGNPPVSTVGSTKKAGKPYGSGGSLAPGEKGVKPDLVADGGSPKPTEDPPPSPPCLCSCFSIFSSSYWSCQFGGGICCTADPPHRGGDPGPVNAEYQPNLMKKDSSAIEAQRWHGASQTKGCSASVAPPVELGDAPVRLTPDRVTKMLAQLSREIRPGAVAGLERMLPVGSAPLRVTAEERAVIESYVLHNLKVPAEGGQPQASPRTPTRQLRDCSRCASGFPTTTYRSVGAAAAWEAASSDYRGR
jgi:hypothetical protein